MVSLSVLMRFAGGEVGTMGSLRGAAVSVVIVLEFELSGRGLLVVLRNSRKRVKCGFFSAERVTSVGGEEGRRADATRKLKKAGTLQGCSEGPPAVQAANWSIDDLSISAPSIVTIGIQCRDFSLLMQEYLYLTYRCVLEMVANPCQDHHCFWSFPCSAIQTP